MFKYLLITYLVMFLIQEFTPSAFAPKALHAKK